jgi:hypothetical protein
MEALALLVMDLLLEERFQLISAFSDHRLLSMHRGSLWIARQRY